MQRKINEDLGNSLRILALDMVENACSGHSGMPLGMADVFTVLFKDFLCFNPKDPSWTMRDRLILSAGHGSALLYAALFLSGYGYTVEDLKNFRKIGSKTPGHPEYNVHLGIETTTGPLGQGLANAVGIAISERLINHKIPEFSHKTYAVVGDGCLMEGISYEAASLAGHLNLANLIVIYDSNGISIDGPVSLSFSEDIKQRFESMNWRVLQMDGHCYQDIYDKLKAANLSDKATVIIAKTKIGYGSGLHEGKASAHGSVFGKAEVQRIRNYFDYHYEPFEMPDSLVSQWRAFSGRCMQRYRNWQSEVRPVFEREVISQKLPKDFFTALKFLMCSEKHNDSTRKSSGRVIEALASSNLNLIGGSADLTPSNCTKAAVHKAISRDDFSGNYIHYGIREHAMVAIMSGIALHGFFRAYGGTFLAFSDYCRPAIRLAAMMNLPVIYVMTHDSIGIGEDGPTHQPIEQLYSLRSIPNLTVLRPCDASETIESWEIALQNNGPTLLALSRQELQPLRVYREENLCAQGGYIIYQSEQKLQVNLIATGSEVQLAINVSKLLEKRGIGVNVVSMPGVQIFLKQSDSYKEGIIARGRLNAAIEAGLSQSLGIFCADPSLSFGINEFGASGSPLSLYQKFLFTENDIAMLLLKKIVES